MKKTVLAAIVALCFVQLAKAQPGRYLIQFKDKAQTPYTLNQPEQFLSPRSIARRTRYGIGYDNTDLPVTPAYVDSLRALTSVTVLNVSKWLNQVSIQVTNAAVLDTINRFPFVQATRYIASRNQRIRTAPEDEDLDTPAISGIKGLSTAEGTFDYGAANAQVNIHNGAFLHNIGLQGQGMIISLLDAGFYHYTTLKAFDSINQNGQVLGTWDFVAGDTSVVEDHQHGMACFSTIAANIPGTFVGTAPKAFFYLFRSEDAGSEYPIEEHNWVCAAERVDSAGGDVISSSLGYTQFNDPSLNHTYADLNGDITMAAVGADLAAKKGILVVNAAGNDGAKPWKYLSTPADADSVLAVGAVNAQGHIAPFSSYGPSSDGQVKPDVVSVGAGTVIQGANDAIVTGNGTSFACPNMAGLASCLWQGFPEFNNMKIIDALRRSSHLFQTPNERMGYGIPDVKKAVSLLLADFATVTVTACNTLNWTSKDFNSMHYAIERQKRGETGFTTVAEQRGTGAIFQTHSYQFTDTSITLQDGPVLYRVRQIIDTSTNGFADLFLGTTTISSAACTPVPSSERGIQVIPNPVQQSFSVKMDSAPVANLQFVIVNSIGQTIYTQRTTKPEGITVFPISAIRLTPGVYYLMVFDGRKRLATKPFIKL